MLVYRGRDNNLVDVDYTLKFKIDSTLKCRDALALDLTSLAFLYLFAALNMYIWIAGFLVLRGKCLDLFLKYLLPIFLILFCYAFPACLGKFRIQDPHYFYIHGSTSSCYLLNSTSDKEGYCPVRTNLSLNVRDGAKLKSAGHGQRLVLLLCQYKIPFF